MVGISKLQIPSLILIAFGLYIGVSEVISHIEYISGPTSHRFGLARLVLMGFLLFAGAIIAIGIRGFLNHDPVLSLSVLVGLVALRGTFAIELYSQGMKTEHDLLIGAALTLLPAVATYLVLSSPEYLMVDSTRR